MSQALVQATRSEATTVGIIGGSGFTGGELLRLLLQHPGAEVVGATSGQYAGKPLHRAHPNLRGFTDLRFTPRDGLPDAELVFSCLPHQRSAEVVGALRDQGTRVIDLSADFRLRSAEAYQQWYGVEHPRPDLLPATYGLPEAHRDAISSAQLVSGVGCVATSMNLALLPLARAGLLDGSQIVANAMIGSSAAGADTNDAGMHAHRSRSMRLYAPTGHRHAAEVEQLTGTLPHVSVHATELVRGVVSTMHIMHDEVPDERTLWQAFRASYNDEPFVRIVKERQGIHRGPDPKLVAGSNLADVGFHVEDGRIVVQCALDNLVKGAAGSAVQCFNLMTSQPETTGLWTIPVGPQ